jgi:hypothetical protein
MAWEGASVAQRSQPKAVKPKMRACKLRSGLHLKEGSKQKGVKQELSGLISKLKRPYADDDTMKLRFKQSTV